MDRASQIAEGKKLAVFKNLKFIILVHLPPKNKRKYNLVEEWF